MVAENCEPENYQNGVVVLVDYEPEDHQNGVMDIDNASVLLYASICRSHTKTTSSHRKRSATCSNQIICYATEVRHALM